MVVRLERRGRAAQHPGPGDRCGRERAARRPGVEPAGLQEQRRRGFNTSTCADAMAQGAEPAGEGSLHSKMWFVGLAHTVKGLTSSHVAGPTAAPQDPELCEFPGQRVLTASFATSRPRFKSRQLHRMRLVLVDNMPEPDSGQTRVLSHACETPRLRRRTTGSVIKYPSICEVEPIANLSHGAGTTESVANHLTGASGRGRFGSGRCHVLLRR